MMRDILIKSMFRMNAQLVTEMAGSSACPSMSCRNWLTCAAANG